MEEQQVNAREMAEESEETDALPFDSSVRQVSRRSSKSPPATPPDTTDSSVAWGPGCQRDDEEYNMRHPRRGVALIFNHQTFEPPNPRDGSAKDCADLSEQLKDLRFEVRLYKDLTYNEIKLYLSKTSKEDHSAADCLVVVVMSHGGPGKLYARDIKYKAEELWQGFVGDKCPSLIGKPKLFFIQACRGKMRDSGAKVEFDGHSASSYTIPTQADILIAYSTVEGHKSVRDPKKGTWFIQALCKELRVNGYKRDLLTLLTFVCRRVAIDHGNVEKKQIPSINSMLTRLVYFR